MDESGSITDNNPENTHGLYNWNLMQDFVARIIESLNVGPDFARISVTKFSSVSETEFDLDEYDNKEDMVAAVLNFEYKSGSTNISGALRTLRTEVFARAIERSGVPKIGILITDGEATVEEDTVEEEARLLKDVRIRIPITT